MVPFFAIHWDSPTWDQTPRRRHRQLLVSGVRNSRGPFRLSIDVVHICEFSASSSLIASSSLSPYRGFPDRNPR